MNKIVITCFCLLSIASIHAENPSFTNSTYEQMVIDAPVHMSLKENVVEVQNLSDGSTEPESILQPQVSEEALSSENFETWGTLCRVVHRPNSENWKWAINKYDMLSDEEEDIFGVSINRKIQSVACLPDGSGYIFSLRETKTGDYEIYQYRPEDEAPLIKLTDNDSDDVDVTMNEDGSVFAWQQRLSDGRQAILLNTGGVQRSLASASPFVQPSLSPNGKWLVFVQLRKSFFAVMRYDIDNKKFKEIRKVPRRKKLYHPSVSNDGNLVGWSENKKQNRYLVKNLSENTLTEVVNNKSGIEHGVLSGGGSLLAYSINANDTKETYLTNLETLATSKVGETLQGDDRYLAVNWLGGAGKIPSYLKPFTIKVDVPKSDWWASSYNTFTVKTRQSNKYSYNYIVDWGDGHIDYDVTGDLTHEYTDHPDGGEFIVKIYGQFPSFDFIQDPIKSIEQWGSIKWEDLSGSFQDCSDLTINATDLPDFSNLSSMSSMFEDVKGASCYPSNMSLWDVSNVMHMDSMFHAATSYLNPVLLNQDISAWDVSNVQNMNSMFSFWDEEKFSLDISSWNVSNVTDMDYAFYGTQVDTDAYDKMLINWAKLNLQQNVTLDMGKSDNFYSSSSKEARNVLRQRFGWTLQDAGISDPRNTKPFITTWQTDRSNQITISPLSYDSTPGTYSIDWGDGTSDDGVRGSKAHTYPRSGVYTVSVYGVLGSFSMNDLFDKDVLLSVEQWGDIEWKQLSGAFSRADNLMINATDAPDLADVDDLSSMFYQASNFNSNINHWDVSSIKDMGLMFTSAKSFNQDLNNWDVSNVTNFGSMFNGAESFNGNIGSWDLSSAELTRSMFREAKSFNQDISAWHFPNLTDVGSMFDSASSFNQNISAWDTSGITRMTWMFENATSFNQDLSSWDFTSIDNMGSMLDGSGLSVENYSSLLVSWASQDVPSGLSVEHGIPYLPYAESARFQLINNKGWRFDDGGLFDESAN